MVRGLMSDDEWGFHSRSRYLPNPRPSTAGPIGKSNHRRADADTFDFVFDVYPFCAVQFPAQFADPECPRQVPRPLAGERRPDPEADLSCTTTDARTAPLEATFPRNLTRLGSVIFPSEMFTSKAYVGSPSDRRKLHGS